MLFPQHSGGFFGHRRGNLRQAQLRRTRQRQEGLWQIPRYASKLRRSVWAATLSSFFLMLPCGHEGAPLRLMHSLMF